MFLRYVIIQLRLFSQVVISSLFLSLLIFTPEKLVLFEKIYWGSNVQIPTTSLFMSPIVPTPRDNYYSSQETEEHSQNDQLALLHISSAFVKGLKLFRSCILAISLLDTPRGVEPRSGRKVRRFRRGNLVTMQSE